MDPSFVAYIDESGDDGFVFKPDGKGSTRWLILSAVIVRKTNDYQLREALKTARTALGKDPKHVFHFSKMQHHHVLPVCKVIGQLPIKIVSVLANKSALPNIPSYSSQKNRLYHYMTRVLAERVSWVCKDKRKLNEGDGTVRLIFSNRATMSYDELRTYFQLLKDKPKSEDVRIDWSSIRPEDVESEKHELMAGLQIADFVASGTRLAAEPRHGVADFGYLKQFASRLYKRNEKLFGYGLKFYPDFDKLKSANPHLAEFADF